MVEHKQGSCYNTTRDSNRFELARTAPPAGAPGGKGVAHINIPRRLSLKSTLVGLCESAHVPLRSNVRGLGEWEGQR